jgi:hypothetical protein
MAKSKDTKGKKDSKSVKVKESNVGRGRPSSKKSKEETSDKKDLKSENKKEPEIKLSETDLLFKKIYGNEPIKDAIPIPVTEQKTQTTTIVNEYNIDVQRLPQGVLDLVNSFTSVFNTILQNPLLASNYISDFLDKDTKSFNAIKEWVESRKDNLVSYKLKTKGGTSTANVSTKVIVNAENVNTIKNIPANTQQPQINHGQNPLTPRDLNGGGTYQHHIHSNPIVNNPHINNVENKNIHHEMLAKNNHFGDVHLQQNPSQHIEQKVVVSPQQYIQDYSNGIMTAINGHFRMAHSGYIDLDTLNSILNSLDKSFEYEIIQNGKESYLNISKGEDRVTTPKFSIF